MKYTTVEHFTVIRQDLTHYIEEAERVGNALYELYKDVKDKTINVNVVSKENQLNTNIPICVEYPVFIYFTIMPDVKAVDVSINFHDAIHKFIMKWED